MNTSAQWEKERAGIESWSVTIFDALADLGNLAWSLFFGGNELERDTDYTVRRTAYEGDEACADYVFQGTGKYYGTVHARVYRKSQAIDLGRATIAPIADVTYTGSAIRPKVTVTLDGATLREGTDYTLGYENNVNAGAATVTVTGKGNYVGTAKGTFKIARAKVAAPAATNRTYNGKAQAGVAAGAGYVLSGTASATNADGYTATATPDANHEAATSNVATLTVAKAAQPMKVKAAKRTAKASAAKKKAVTVAAPLKFTKKAQGKVTYAKVARGSDKCLTVNKKTGKVTIKQGTKKGTYKVKVKVSAKGNKNYKAGSKTVTCTVVVK